MESSGDPTSSKGPKKVLGIRKFGSGHSVESKNETILRRLKRRKVAHCMKVSVNLPRNKTARGAYGRRNFRLMDHDLGKRIFSAIVSPDITSKCLEDNIIYHGTTTVSFKFCGGIMVAADSRASGGFFIGSDSVPKIFPINHFTLGTMAGGAGHCTFWSRSLMKENRLNELRYKERLSLNSCAHFIKSAARILRNNDMKLSLSGLDVNNEYRIIVVSKNGCHEIPRAIAVGSGAPTAEALLDREYKWNMTYSQAKQLAIKCISFAAFRDAYTGGRFCVYYINEDGWSRVLEDDLHQYVRDYRQSKAFK